MSYAVFNKNPEVVGETRERNKKGPIKGKRKEEVDMSLLFVFCNVIFKEGIIVNILL